MKLKSLVFGAAAGMLAVSGAQAADLPPAPHPVDYVRICDAFGSGFFYIPGTDSCLRLRGRLRTEVRYRYENTNTIRDFNGAATNPTVTGAGWGTRQNSPFFFRARGYWGWDHRTNTDVGLVRAFFRGYIDRDTRDSNTVSLNLDFAFIQIGGLTVGYADLIIEPVYLTYTTIHAFGMSGLDDESVLAQYEYSFGNGFSVGAVIWDPSIGSFGSASRSNLLGAGALTSEYGGVRIPNLGGAITYDGSFGTFRLAGLIQDIRPNNARTNVIGHDHDIGWGIGFSGDIGVPLGTNTRVGFNVQYADGIVNFIHSDLPGLASDFSVTSAGSTTTSKGWSAGAGVTTQVFDRTTFNLSGSYARVRNSNATTAAPALTGLGIGRTFLNFTGAGSNYSTVSVIDVAANLQYQLTSNLVITGEVAWRDLDINSSVGQNAINVGHGFSTLLRAQLDF